MNGEQAITQQTKQRNATMQVKRFTYNNGKADTYYIDSRRVSKAFYMSQTIYADMFMRVSCLHTAATKQGYVYSKSYNAAPAISMTNEVMQAYLS